jgi:hypothetical protein
MCNKIIANPARFVFTNAVAWNTFLTAVYSVRLAIFNLVKQAVNGLGESIYQHLESTLIFYLFKKFRPDAMMADRVNPAIFRDRYQIPDIPTLQAVVAKSVLDSRPSDESFNSDV